MFKVLFSLCLVFSHINLITTTAHAASSSGVVITQIMAGIPGAATQEVVTIYNNSSSEIDITGWCIESKNVAKFACVQMPVGEKLFLPAHKYAKLASTSYALVHPIPAGSTDQYDVIFTTNNQNSGNITGSTDSIKLFDANNVLIDMAMWDTSLPAGSIWQRIEQLPGIFKDTDSTDIAQDFTKLSTFTIATSSTYEVVTSVDVCANIREVQTAVPSGYVADGAGNCIRDICPNLSGLQTTLPAGYIMSQSGECVLDIAPLQLTELLPNAAGTDTGHEYIELFNPASKTVDLSAYRIAVGVNADKSYAFPAGATIAPGAYTVFSDADMKFSLVNTSGKATLLAVDGTIVSVSDQYDSAGDDMAWAFIDGKWQYSNQPTPGAANVPSLDDETTSSSSTATPPPCPAGKYRNPLTNRCRNIDSDAAVLASCDADQYRNPETGRCRKVTAASMVTPCKEGQYRSEETNRCRNITAASTLTPCAEGQERNPTTNRCRNVAAKAVPAAAFAVQPVKDGMKAFVGWWALGGIGVLALGYAGWEWRREVRVFVKGIPIAKIFRK